MKEVDMNLVSDVSSSARSLRKIHPPQALNGAVRVVTGEL